jgi:hypothetical protein
MPGMLTFLRLRVESEVGETMQNGATAGICEIYKHSIQTLSVENYSNFHLIILLFIHLIIESL